jgi:plastocyanin
MTTNTGKLLSSVLRVLPAAALVLLLAPPRFVSAETITIPAVTSLPPGAAASPFFSDVRAFNISYTTPVSVTAVYRCFLGACPATAPQVTFTLAARESRAFDDMVNATFNAPSSGGAVELTTSGNNLRVTSRLFSTAPMPTVGMFIPGLKNSEAHPVAVLTQLANGAFRTNIGVYNGEDSGATVTIRHFHGATQLGSQVVNLGPHSGTQINRIFDVVGQAALTTTNAFAVVETSSPTAEVFSYAAVIDNATTDPIFVTGAEDSPAPAGPGPSQTINVDASNYAFTPGSTEPIQVTAGAATTLFFQASVGSHGFSGIPALGIAASNSISAAVDDDGYYGGGGHPAQTYRVTFTAPASARGQTYDFWCTVHPTVMRGTLRVN